MHWYVLILAFTPVTSQMTSTSPVSAEQCFNDGYDPHDVVKAARPPSPKKKPLRHYKRLKIEKDELTKEIARLSKALTLEKATRKETRAPPPTNSVWKPIARRRLERRLAAEAERRWLEAAIRGRTELIDDLAKVVHQHVRIAGLIAASPQRHNTPLFIEPTDELLYDMEMQEISALYRQTDAVFQTCGLDLTSTETTHFQRTVTTDANGVSIQYVRRQHMLFSYEHTWKSFWMLSQMVHRQDDREDYRGFQQPETSLGTRFRITKRGQDGKRLSLKERFVARRFTEENRTVLVWKALLAGEGPYSGMQTEETGWSVIRPSTTGSGAVVEMVMRQVPLHLSSPTSVPEHAANAFNNLLQSVIQENSQEITNGAKDMLLGAMLTGIIA
jgi:hypothetical protein